MLIGIIWSGNRERPRHMLISEGGREGPKEGRGQPECFHGDWVSPIPLRGQRSLTRRSICQAASGGSQSRGRETEGERYREKEDQSEGRLEGGERARRLDEVRSLSCPGEKR